VGRPTRREERPRSAQRAPAERARHAGNDLLLLVRRNVLSGKLRLHVGDDLRVKSVAASRAGGPGCQILSGDGLRGLLKCKRTCFRRSGDSEAEPHAPHCTS